MPTINDTSWLNSSRLAQIKCEKGYTGYKFLCKLTGISELKAAYCYSDTYTTMCSNFAVLYVTNRLSNDKLNNPDPRYQKYIKTIYTYMLDNPDCRKYTISGLSECDQLAVYELVIHGYNKVEQVAKLLTSCKLDFIEAINVVEYMNVEDIRDIIAMIGDGEDLATWCMKVSKLLSNETRKKLMKLSIYYTQNYIYEVLLDYLKSP